MHNWTCELDGYAISKQESAGLFMEIRGMKRYVEVDVCLINEVLGMSDLGRCILRLMIPGEV